MLRVIATAVIFFVAGGAAAHFLVPRYFPELLGASRTPPQVAPKVRIKPSDRVFVTGRVISAYPSGLPIYGTLGKRLTDQLRAVSGGAISFTLVEPGKDNPPGSCFKRLKEGKTDPSGRIDACWSSPALWHATEKALALFGGAPFGPDVREMAAWISFGGGEELLNEIYARHGIKSIICGVAAPDAGGWFRKPIENLESLKGLRMRIYGLGARVIEKLGVTTRHLNGEQIITALRTGQIDAAEYSMPAIDVGVGFHKLVNHYYFPGWHQQAALLEVLVSLSVWKALPETTQATIESVCGDNFRYGLAESEAIQASALRALRAKGVTIHQWPKEVLEGLRKAWLEVVKEEIAVDATFKKVWDSLTSFQAEYATWKRIATLPASPPSP